jgi:hypothetical protein
MSDNIKSMTKVLNYVERSNYNKLCYLNSIKESDLINIFCPNIKDEINRKTGKKKSAADCKLTVNCMKKYIRTAHGNKGVMNQVYKYKTLECNERCYGDGLTFQGMRAELRDYLAQDNYNDIDLHNCAPRIALYLAGKEKVLTPLLQKYCDDRKAFLEEHIKTWTKHDILISCITGKKKKSHWPEVVKLLYDEVQRIRKVYIPDATPENSASLWSKLIQQHENKLLFEAVEYVGPENVGALIHDGFLLDKSFELHLSDLNELPLAKKMCMTWTHKKSFFKHDMDLSLMTNTKEEGIEKSYAEVKEEFEAKFCKILVPTLYVEEYICPITNEKKVFVHDNIRARCESIFYNIRDDEGAIKKKCFIADWLKDPEKRQYQNMDFFPYSKINNTHPSIFNTFTGFNAEEKESFTKPDWFINHCKHLAGGDEKSKDYLINYLAHLVQKPYEKPEVAIILRGEQGAGKDSMIDALSKIIGKKFVHRTSNMQDAFGNFTSSLKDNLIYQFNEVDSKDGFGNNQSIKDIITCEEHQINEKCIRPYPIRNCSRFFFFSNCLTVVDIPPDDRRFVVFKTGEKLSAKYYCEYFDKVNDEDEIANLYTYLLNVDITKFKPRNDRPKTDNYQIMTEMSIPTLYYFINYEKFLGQYKATDIYSRYNKYCEKQKIKSELGIRTMCKMIYELKGITRKRYNTGMKITFTQATHEYLNKKFFKKVYGEEQEFLSDSESESEVDDEEDEAYGSVPSGLDKGIESSEPIKIIKKIKKKKLVEI